MVEAVLFAWGHTLAVWAPDDEPREEARKDVRGAAETRPSPR